MTIPGLSISEFKVFLDIASTVTTYDSDLDTIMCFAEQAIEDYCQRTFHWEAAISELVSIREPQTWLALKKWPINSVAGVTTDWQNTKVQFTVATEIVVDEDMFGAGVIQINLTNPSTVHNYFYPGIQNNAITYCAGYCGNAPYNLREAVYRTAQVAWNARASAMGISSESLGDWSVGYNADILKSLIPRRH